MEDLKIYTVISSRYTVFDQSGKLPFSIVFGLCRRSKEDADPRALQLNTENSFLDVPYALQHGLLGIYVQDQEPRTERRLDIGELLDRKGSGERPQLVLSSPLGRAGNWREHLLEYQYHVDPESDLAKLFETGKQYYIRIAKQIDIGGAGHIYLDQKSSSDTHRTLPNPEETVRLASSGGHGRAWFVAVPSLSWPPNIHTKMQLHASEGNTNAALLEVIVTNTSNEAITVQTRGSQRYLMPRGPMFTIPPNNALTRLIDSKSPYPGSHIHIIDATTKIVVRAAKTNFTCVLYGHNYDPRPRRETLVSLKPGKPLVRQVDVSKLLSQLPDGAYNLRMEPWGLWWCVGDRDEFAPDEGDRVPHDLYKTHIPPLMLECDDIVQLQVENGVAKYM